MTQLSKFYHCIFCRKASMFGLFQKRVQASLYYSVRKLPTFLIESTQSVYHAPGLWWHPVRRNSPSLNDPFYLVKEQVLNYSITKSHSFQISIHWRCERSMVRESHSAGWREYLPTWKKSKDYHQSKSTIHRISQLKNISTCDMFIFLDGSWLHLYETWWLPTSEKFIEICTSLCGSLSRRADEKFHYYKLDADMSF